MQELAKGLRDHFDEPALTGSLMTDYRCLAAKLAVVLGDPCRSATASQPPAVTLIAAEEDVRMRPIKPTLR